MGKDVPNLSQPHRRLVCYCRLYEIQDINRKEKVGQHQRDAFLFNDLLLITKTTSRSRNNSTVEYQYRSSTPLDGLQVLVFSNSYYAFGIRISRRVDNKVVATFNARNELDQQRFVDDLQESVAEMDEMEQLRITKSNSLVHLNMLDKKDEQPAAKDAADGNKPQGVGEDKQQQQQQQQVVSSQTDVTTCSSFSSMSPSSVSTGNGAPVPLVSQPSTSQSNRHHCNSR